MARIEGRSPSPRRPNSEAGESQDTEERTPVASRRVVDQPVDTRRGRFGYYSGFRPARHRWIGIALLVAGILIAVLNDAMLFGDDITLLPFGHQELWLIFGLVVASSGTWLLGLFDPSLKRRPRAS